MIFSIKNKGNIGLNKYTAVDYLIARQSRNRRNNFFLENCVLFENYSFNANSS